MSKITNIFKSWVNYLKNITISYNTFKYAVFYGFLGVLIMLIFQVITVIIFDLEDYSNSQHIIPTFVFSIFAITVLIYIWIKKLNEKNKYANIFIRGLPYFLAIIGFLIESQFADHNYRLIAFSVLMMMLTWVQIHGVKTRIALFVLSAANYIMLSYFEYGNGNTLYVDITFAIFLSLFSILSSSIIYHLHKSHSVVHENLNNEITRYAGAIDKLNSAHSSLKISKNMTDNMYELTQEVLKNERIEDVLQMVLDKAARLIPNCQAGSILIREEEKMKFVAAIGYDLNNLKKINLSIKETFQDTLEDLYEPAIIRNLEVFDEVHMGKNKKDKYIGVVKRIAKSCMTCSFKYQDDFFGSINVDNFESEDVFNDNDKYLVKQLAQEIGIIISIHELYEQALRPTKFDELTQAMTRTHCISLLKTLIDSKPLGMVSICTIDINNLKEINDKYGHDVGDRFLFEFAEGVRRASIIDNIFGRIGGDEFLLIFADSTHEKSEEQILIIKEYFSAHKFAVDNKLIEISFASGIATYNLDGHKINELIKLSDKRMYIDKNNLKNSK